MTSYLTSIEGRKIGINNYVIEVGWGRIRKKEIKERLFTYKMH